MSRTRIKICGVTRVADAIAAAEAGADAIGLVFHPPSKRNVSVERAREIVAALPPFMTAVGLFVDAPPGQVLSTASALRLPLVQLHGRETPEYVAALGLPAIKAVRVSPETFAAELDRWRQAVRDGLTLLRGLVLETPEQGPDAAPGGTGVANDWAAITRSRDAGAFAGLRPLIAAGGLTPETVAGVVRAVRPWAVDVSSGVEGAMKGEKSESRIRDFVAAVRSADGGT